MNIVLGQEINIETGEVNRIRLNRGGVLNFSYYYYRGLNYIRRDYNILKADIKESLCYISRFRKVYIGLYLEIARPVYIYPDLTERENVLRRKG